MSFAFAEVRQIASELEVDEQKSGLVCPNCRGGADKETSLSVKRTSTGVTFLCHRNKCGWKGHIPMVLMNQRTVADREKIPDTAKRFYGTLEDLPPDIVEKLCKKYQLTGADITRAGWLWSPEMDGGRICMPIYGRFGWVHGHSFRTLDKRKQPKNRIILTTTNEPLMCFYKSPIEPVKGAFGMKLPLVIVEDQISALRVSKFCNAVALIGTNLNDQKVIELRKATAPEHILALDEDAKVDASKYIARYGEMLRNFRMVQLTKDLKDCTDEQIEGVLGLCANA